MAIIKVPSIFLFFNFLSENKLKIFVYLFIYLGSHYAALDVLGLSL